jgi:preprotein translocase subunit SecD
MVRLLMFFAALLVASPAFAARDFRIGPERFAEAEILDARALASVDGMPVLMITLAETAATRLHRLTLSMTGQPLPVLLNGKELSAPIVREPIAGGVLEISGLQDFRECERIAREISGKDPVPDSLED